MENFKPFLNFIERGHLKSLPLNSSALNGSKKKDQKFFGMELDTSDIYDIIIV